MIGRRRTGTRTVSPAPADSAGAPVPPIALRIETRAPPTAPELLTSYERVATSGQKPSGYRVRIVVSEAGGLPQA